MTKLQLAWVTLIFPVAGSQVDVWTIKNRVNVAGT